MAANVLFKLLADDSTPDNPHILAPGTVLYRGMAVYAYFHEIYATNAGTVVYNPAHSHVEYSGLYGIWRARKVTGSAKDATGHNITTAATPGLANSTDTIYIAYATGSISLVVGPTAIPDLSNQMPNGRCYDMWSAYLVPHDQGLGNKTYIHKIGGTD